MSISDTKKAQQYASIAETAAAQAKLAAEELANAPDYAQQAAASASAASASAQTAVAAESTVQALSNAASQSASNAAVSASEAASAADSAIGRTVRAPSGESLSALPAASARASSVPVFGGDGGLSVKAIAEFATLDSSGKIPVSVIPAIALTEPFVANSQAAMLALDAQVGDICKRTDLGYSFCLASAPPSTLANWIQLTDDVLAQLGQKTGATQVGAADDSNNPTTVQAALNNKVSASTLSQSTGASTVGYTTGTVASQLDGLNQFKTNITSASGVTYVGGAAAQSDLTALGSFVTPEQFSSLVVGDDWSDAINAALATGKEFQPVVGKTYKVTKIINSNGQPFLGKIKLQLARTSIPNATFEVEYSRPSETGFFRGIYVQSAYDLCEMLRIKSMGFNTVLHYCYFDNGAADVNGTIPQLIKNAATAGLNVVINTENSVAHNNGTIAQVVAAADGFTNVIGYSVLDEPGSRGISLATQESSISTLRALTTKKLYCVDYLWAYLNAWTKPWSYNYDVFLVDSYSMYYASGDLTTRINRDLGKMRTDLGAAMKMTGSAKVIPCFQAYVDPTSTPVEKTSPPYDGTYCFDVPQITGAGRIFGRSGNGDFACFVWDGGFSGNVANNSGLQAMIAELMSNAGHGQKMLTQPIIFGGVASVYQRSLHDITEVISQKDPQNTATSGDGAFLGGNSWPVRLITGSAEGLIRTTTTGIDISGIGFNGTFSRLVTTKSVLKYFTGFGVFENYGNTLTHSASFDIYSTSDGGYTENLRFTTGVTAGQPFRFSSLMTNSYDGIGENAVFSLSIDSSDAMTNYRRFIYGMFVSTNW